MSMNKTLKSKSSLERHRNVLSRAERIAKLKDDGQWADGRSPYGLPKIAHRKPKVGKKVKEKKEETAAGAGEAAAAPAVAAAAAKPAGGKPAK